MGVGEKAKQDAVGSEKPGGKAAGGSQTSGAPPVRAPTGSPSGAGAGAATSAVATGPESGARLAALQLDIHDLESKVITLTAAVAAEKARSLALETAAANATLRLASLESERSSFSDACDAAGAVATAAMTELREVKAVCDGLRRERDAARSERETARANAAAAEARIAELEAALAAMAAARATDEGSNRALQRRLQEQESLIQTTREDLQRAQGQIALLKGLVGQEKGQ